MCLPDDVGNLYESINHKDRTYGSGGRLEKQGKWRFKYDDKGNLVKKCQFWGDTREYEWNSAGMLEKVIRPDKQEVTFKYDALGRRIEKSFGNIVTKWLWNGNVPLHEWTECHIRDYNQESGEFVRVEKHPVVTWGFEEGTFVPVAKLTAKESYSIITNYMGTPEAMYDSCGEQTWSCDLDSYGRVRKHSGNLCDCPWRFQGQYEDEETGLYYNRFRYYSPETGMYISQDPIKILGGLTLYSYVHDENGWVDALGLKIAAPSSTVNSTPTTTIYGKGQVTGVGHAPAMENIAAEIAKSGCFKEVYMDLAWNTANHTSTGTYSKISQRRPDLILVGNDGKIISIEVASASDDLTTLYNRNNVGNANGYEVFEYGIDYDPQTGTLTESGKKKIENLCS